MRKLIFSLALAALFCISCGGGGGQQAVISTDYGDITIVLYDHTPMHRDNFIKLVKENYYDDLEARYGLDVALLSTLRQHHILYDRSETGEFFHLYTQMIAGRFFFEVVQRNNYDEFGAANAPIRLAAQTRIDRQQQQNKFS